MNWFNRILAGMYYFVSFTKKEEGPSLLSLIAAQGYFSVQLFCIIISAFHIYNYYFIDHLVDLPIHSKADGVIVWVLLYPIIYYLSESGETIFQFVRDTDEEELTKYYRIGLGLLLFNVLILVIVALLFQIELS